MKAILSIGRFAWQFILISIFSILHIGTMLLHLICVAIAFGYRVSWFWWFYEVQTYFRANLVAYWALYFMYRAIYGG